MTNGADTPNPNPQPNQPGALPDFSTDKGLSAAFVDYAASLTSNQRTKLKELLGELFGTSRDVAENWTRPVNQDGHRDFVSTNRAVKPMPEVPGSDAAKNSIQYKQAQARTAALKREFVKALYNSTPASENGDLNDPNARCYEFGPGGDNTDFNMVDRQQLPGSGFKSLSRFRSYLQSGIGDEPGLMQGNPSIRLKQNPKSGSFYFELCYYRDSDPVYNPESLFEMDSF